MGNFISITKEGRIATLVMSRPERLNAISALSDCDDIVAAIDAVNADPAISVAILTGAGRAFCAGGDLKGMRDRTGVARLENAAATRANYRLGIQRIPRAFQSSEVPLVAAVNGHAIGLGNDIACLCDIRIAAEDARFAASFVKIGLVPGDGGAWILPRIVGISKAAEMMLTGDAIDAAEALAFGLVSSVVPGDALMDAAIAIAERIARNPPGALRLTRRLLIEGQSARLSDMLEMSAAFQAIAHEADDHDEAIAAILEKRPPRFSGR